MRMAQRRRRGLRFGFRSRPAQARHGATEKLLDTIGLDLSDRESHYCCRAQGSLASVRTRVNAEHNRQSRFQQPNPAEYEVNPMISLC